MKQKTVVISFFIIMILAILFVLGALLLWHLTYKEVVISCEEETDKWECNILGDPKPFIMYYGFSNVYTTCEKTDFYEPKECFEHILIFTNCKPCKITHPTLGITKCITKCHKILGWEPFTQPE